MSERRPVFRIMSVGWDYLEWTGAFYPDDLPPDWRLAYYANEFPGVLIPDRLWLTVGSGTLESWVDDVRESFRFYLEVDGAIDTEECLNKIHCLGNNFGGIVMDYRRKPESPLVNIFPGGLAKEFPLYEMGSNEPGLKTSLPHQVGIALRIPTKYLADPMSQRRFLEELAGHVAPGAETLLFLDGDPPAIEKFHKFKILAQLLRLA